MLHILLLQCTIHRAEHPVGSVQHNDSTNRGCVCQARVMWRHAGWRWGPDSSALASIITKVFSGPTQACAVLCRPAPQKELTWHRGSLEHDSPCPQLDRGLQGQDHRACSAPPSWRQFQEANSPEPAHLLAPCSVQETQEPLACLLPSRLQGGPAGGTRERFISPSALLKAFCQRI